MHHLKTLVQVSLTKRRALGLFTTVWRRTCSRPASSFGFATAVARVSSSRNIDARAAAAAVAAAEGNMAPRQTTLKFSKPDRPQQTKLPFVAKSSLPKDEKTTDAEDAAEKNRTAAKENGEPSKGKTEVEEVKTEDGSESKGGGASDSGKESKKRARPATEVKTTSAKASAETTGRPSAVDEDDDAPPTKKPRKTRKVIQDDEDEDEIMEDPQPTKAVKTEKTRKTPAGKPGLPRKTQASPPESPKSSKSPKKKSPDKAAAAAAKKNAQEAADKKQSDAEDASAASATESEAEGESGEEEEKPEVLAKAPKTVQTTLPSVSATEPLHPDWKAGEPVPYVALCKTLSLVELTSKRLIIAEYCSLFLQQVLRLTPDDLLPTVMLMINKLAADYAGVELGIGESLIMKAIGETTGRNANAIKQDQKAIGDLGLVAIKSRSTQPTMFKPKPLTVRSVLKGLIEIATVAGNGAQGRKISGIKKLLAAADTAGGKVDITKDKGGPSEAKFIVRFLEGKLRLGLAERTVLVSLAQAVVAHEAQQSGKVLNTEDIAKAERTLKTVYSELPSYDVIIPAMLEHGITNLREHCKLRPGVPLKPMLAKPTKAITEVLDRFEGQKFTCEYKYDGERAQIHYVAKDADAEQQKIMDSAPGATKLDGKSASAGVAAIFSRNSEDLSKKYPDVLAKLPFWVNAEETKSFVLDCESVAWDVEGKKVLPFQQLMTRKRKDVKAEDVKVQVCVFAFDLLYLNGEALVERPLRERRELLRKAFLPVEGEFAFATSMDGQEIEEIQTFLDESVKASCEGLMVKMLDGLESNYEPSRRSQNWLKLKKDYLSGVGDSLDLVVLGGYHGKGKRTSWYGAFLLACYNPSTECYETVCNIGTGFSEAVLEELHKELSGSVIDRPKPFYQHSAGNQHQPDVWFEPRQVWEVRAADLTLSPRYKAGLREGCDPAGEKGISLRFPRFLKVRDDKKPDEATTSRQVAEMYRTQESVSKNKKPAADDDFEY